VSRPRIMFVNVRRTTLEVRAAFHAARREGYDVVLLADRVPRNLPSSIVVGVEQVNTFDVPAALAAGVRLARRENVAGVVTWSDRDVELTAAITSALGLPGPTPAAARRARNKYLMREALRSEPDLGPRYAEVRSRADLEAAGETVGYPAILKPTGAAGSIGIFAIDGPEDLEPAFLHLLDVTDRTRTPMVGEQSQCLILEERIAGSQHSVEGFVCAKGIHIAGITDHWSVPPHHPDLQEVHPSALAAEDQAAIRELARRVLNRLELDWTAFHLEAKLTPGGVPKLVEVAARIPGAHIGSHLVPMSTGIPFYEGVIRVACGERPDVAARHELVAGNRAIIASGEGAFNGLDGLAELLAMPAVQQVAWELPIGAEVRQPPEDFVSWVVASVIALGGSHAEVLEALREAAARAAIRLGLDGGRALAGAEAP
jgi:biotin carboxylase